LTKEMDKPEK